MNLQFTLLQSRQFWTGVAATILVGMAVMLGMPRYRYMAKRAPAQYAVGLISQDRIAGGGGGGDRDQLMTYVSAGVSSSSGYDDERKMVRNASMELIVKRPKESSDTIRKIAEDAGGFLVNAETNGGENASSASLTIRVPVNKFEEVRAKITQLGARVQSEKVDAQDVTKQYVDLSARLRNLQAQETQYLGILKQARTVKDTVEVSDKLNDVRSQIDQQQAEFAALSKQVETVALTVSLRAEADVQVFGLQWRPLYRLKSAARDGMDGIGDYASAMASFVLFLPALLLWIITIVMGAAIAWRILRWVWGIFFVKRASTA